MAKNVYLKWASSFVLLSAGEIIFLMCVGGFTPAAHLDGFTQKIDVSILASQCREKL